ncbi:hypothetical protein DITRI_Ditri09bG0089700 [Diplodiscus trichospermus]
MVSYAMIVRNLTTDQHVLLEFKSKILDPHNILAYNWTTTTSVCNWVGVSCAAKHRRVRALNLSNMDLSGTIPSHLGNLSFLDSLDLSNNSFHGHLPTEMGQLRHLKFIKLSFNFFRGEIPSWFGRLNKVLYLSLRNNNFTGTIPQSLGNMTKLEILDMTFNLIQGQIPHEISRLLNLRIFGLSYNQIFGHVPSTIYNISSLQMISLSFNNLSGSLPEDICRHLLNLEVLLLISNKFSGQIPSSIDECSNLQNLSLDWNRFNGTIPKSIGNLTKLKDLYLGANNLEGGIPSEIGNLISLETFSAKSMHLDGVIPLTFFNSSSLKEIYLYNNSLSGELPKVISLPNLEMLNLWGNNLRGNIPHSISNVSKLRVLELEQNSFFGPIPNSLGNLRYLEVLRLWSNNLSTETSKDEWNFLFSLADCKDLWDLELSWNPLNGNLPTTISNLPTSLQILHLQDCEMKGNIPMEITRLNNLSWLELSMNELSGSIPATIGSLKTLQTLSIGHNKLQGFLPPEVCDLKDLYELSFGANELDGSLPTCLADLTSLRYLDLHSNKFHSTLPSTFWSLKDILKVDLSSNDLRGPLPFEIGNLKVLIYLNLSRNLLSSGIPSTMGSLIDLQFLDISRNRLEGHIPEALGGLMSLISMNLSNNNLSGFIPKSLERLSDLSYFNVSFNRLEGEIPRGGCFMNFTAESFIKNSALCGSSRLQVPPCKTGIHKKSKKTIVHALTGIFSVIASILAITAFIIVYKKRQNRRTTLATGEALIPLEKWRRVSYHQLWQGTDGFSEHNLLGSGSFGHVYKGILSDGTNVAIKVFNMQMDGAFRSFDIECEVMRSVTHRNLVKVITSCSNIDFKALVLEFMPNGSLEKWLYSDNHFLDIIQRINIMIDVASALEYLHLGHPTSIIHCDLKPSNILLDNDLVAHVGDFGIAKLLGEEEFMKQTMTLATIGYMAPEYGSAGIIFIKTDVYSYGILLMEVFTRKKPTDETFAGEMSMRHWVKMSLSNGIIGVADCSLVHKEDEFFVVKANCISSIITLGLECSSEFPEDRPNMKDVVSKLKNIKREFLNNIENA